MRSRWLFSAHAEQHAPVEMRFIDMFMTALGALIFLALVLVFLLPRTAQEEAQRKDTVPREEYEVLATKYSELAQENEELRRRLAGVTADRPSGMTTGRFTKEILKEWMAVIVFKKGCPRGEPELYVRYEGELADWETGVKTGRYQAPFDSAYPRRKEILVGQTYFDLGNERQNTPFQRSATVPELKENDLEAEIFLGMGGVGRKFSAYVGTEDPSSIGNKCHVRPVFLTWDYMSVGAEVPITRERPFAWLNQYEPGTPIDAMPRKDAVFQVVLKQFSVLQEIRLCRLEAICGTEDAPLYISGAGKGGSPERGVEPEGDFERFEKKAFGWAMQTGSTANSINECETRCRELQRCTRYTYTEDANNPTSAKWCRLITNIELFDSTVAQSGIRREFR